MLLKLFGVWKQESVTNSLVDYGRSISDVCELYNNRPRNHTDVRCNVVQRIGKHIIEEAPEVKIFQTQKARKFNIIPPTFSFLFCLTL